MSLPPPPPVMWAIFDRSLGLVYWGLKCLPPYMGIELSKCGLKCLPPYVGVAISRLSSFHMSYPVVDEIPINSSQVSRKHSRMS